MPSLTRRQIIAWSAVALVILLIGANYLRGQVSGANHESITAITTGLKEKTAKTIRIKVHVAGAVVHPGLYELEDGARIADALESAGGPLPDADINIINLAAKLADGQQVVVPTQGDPAMNAAGTGSVAGGPAQPVNLNNATQNQLEELDGVGPKTAQKIIEYREANGGFKSIEELMDVPGIGPAKYDQLKSQVCV